MNYFLHYLNANRRRLDLAAYGLSDRLTCVVLTPRFRASSHVVALVLADGNPNPVLVAKAPRLLDAGGSLGREAASLQFVQNLLPSGFDTIPKVVAFEDFQGRPILVETALVGELMDPPRMRRDLGACCKATMTWLTDLHRSRQDNIERSSDWFERLVVNPLTFLRDVIPWNQEDRRLLEMTRDLVEPLRMAKLPTVLEHGDLSHPNIMLLNDGRAGVVDWEMADPNGLPCHDLIFFLTYAAFAREQSRENNRHIPAIQAAFFGKTAWARRYLLEYSEQLKLPQDTLTPLFLLCWVRYMAGLMRRLSDSGDALTGETANWLRQNRYYAAWRYSLEHIDQLQWSGAKS